MDPRLTPIPSQVKIDIEPIKKDRLRRQLLPELAGIRSKIAEWRYQDSLTSLIVDWERNFHAALSSNADEETVYNVYKTYITMLQNLLRDSISHTPLDVNSVLGSDGFTYGQVSVALHQLSESIEQKERVPLDILDSSFTKTPHKLVHYMLEWLKKHNALPCSETTEPTSLNLLLEQLTQVTPVSEEGSELDTELIKIRQVIKNWDRNDYMTRKINDWEKEFEKDLKQKSEDGAVCKAYIVKLQDLLRDPLTQAPLDEDSVLGNDGFTYGKKSLDIYQSTLSAIDKEKSPLDPSIVSFAATSHKVVRHMVQWLAEHNALLCSETVEKAHERLLIRQRQAAQVNTASKVSTRRQRINDLIAKRKEKEATIAKIKEEQAIKFQKRVLVPLEEKLSFSFSKKMEEDFANFSKQTKDIEGNLEDLKKRQITEIADLDQRLKKAEKKSLKRIGIPAINVETGFEGKAFSDNLKQQIEERIRSQFEPLQQQLIEFEQSTEEKLRLLAEKFNEEKKALEAKMQSQRKEIEKLETEVQKLSCRQQYLSQEIDQLEIQQIELQKNIYELQIAIEKHKEKSSKAFLKTLAVFGGCLLGTWAVQCLLSSTPVQFSIFPSGKGTGASIGISL